MSQSSERRRGEPDGATRPAGETEGIEDRTSGPSRTSNDGANTSRTLEKDQGFGASHGYPPGHGGPTSPGDAPAKKKDSADAHDPSSRTPKKDAQPDRK